MGGIYKIVTEAEDYPNHVKRVPLSRGDCFYVVGSRDVKIGDKYENYPAIVFHIDYNHKRWWQFWKKKEMVGCQILWLGDE